MKHIRFNTVFYMELLSDPLVKMACLLTPKAGRGPCSKSSASEAIFWLKLVPV